MDISDPVEEPNRKYVHPLCLAHSFISTAKIVSGMKCATHLQPVHGALLLRDDENGHSVAFPSCQECIRLAEINENDCKFNKDMTRTLKIAYPYNAELTNNIIQEIWNNGRNTLFSTHRITAAHTNEYNWESVRNVLDAQSAEFNRNAPEKELERYLEAGLSHELPAHFSYVGTTLFIISPCLCPTHFSLITTGIVLSVKTTNRKYVYPACYTCLSDENDTRFPEDILFAISRIWRDSTEEHLRFYFEQPQEYQRQYAEYTRNRMIY
ncbi:unnamed protein product [Caenorhabditis bovis]|uniref:Uncharacterized protein n=1 Tax=Caenorhabditis bovis TaxID=2654633 RepID=A0A8S1F3W4_9PELO|nr:unnamed protein product [Caenorhabditis bovis]